MSQRRHFPPCRRSWYRTLSHSEEPPSANGIVREQPPSIKASSCFGPLGAFVLVALALGRTARTGHIPNALYHVSFLRGQSIAVWPGTFHCPAGQSHVVFEGRFVGVRFFSSSCNRHTWWKHELQLPTETQECLVSQPVTSRWPTRSRSPQPMRATSSPCVEHFQGESSSRRTSSHHFKHPSRTLVRLPWTLRCANHSAITWSSAQRATCGRWLFLVCRLLLSGCCDLVYH